MHSIAEVSRPIEEEKADEFSEIVRDEVRSSEGFAQADDLGRDGMLLAAAQRFIGEDGGFAESDDEDGATGTETSGEMIPAPICSKIGNTNILILGYMPLDAFGQLTLFTARYEDDEKVKTLPQSEFKSRIDRALRFFKLCYERPELFENDPTASELASHIDKAAAAGRIRALRIAFVTNLRLSTRDYDRQVTAGDIEVNYDIYDIDRLYRASDQSIGATDIDVDFTKWPCGSLPCLEATGKDYEYKSFLLMINGETLAGLFRRFGSRLYDTNLRSFLESKTKVNKGMLATIRNAPRKFLAYNNGLTATAQTIEVATEAGQTCIRRVVGLQIVNGAQTTSTIYKASIDRKQKPDLSNVHVVMKLTKVKPEDIETFVPEITEYANTQNPIKGSDLQANKMLHRRMALWSKEIWCPGHEPRQWFYERTRGSYQAAFAREGTTAKKREEFKERIPNTNRFDKTDMARYHMAWSGRPFIVSKGAQKNFGEFTKLITSVEHGLTEDMIDERFFRNTVAKAIIYQAASKAVDKCAIPNIPAMVKAYLVAYLAHRFENAFRFDIVWARQEVSTELKELFMRWAPAINSEILASNVEGRLLTEWCKQERCWHAVRALDLDAGGIIPPETVPVSSVAQSPLHEGESITDDLDDEANGLAPTSAEEDEDAPHDDDDVMITRKMTPRDWGKIAAWVEDAPGFKPGDREFAYSMAAYASRGWPKGPSVKQARWAARLARGAQRAGVLT